MATTTQSTSTAGHGTTQSTSSEPPASNNIPIEMTDIDTSRQTSGGGQGGLLGDVSIPETSPMGSSFQKSTTPKPTEVAPESDSKPDQSSGVASESTEPLSTSHTAPTSATPGSSAPQDSNTPPGISRLDSVAIGPSSDESPAPAISEAGPVLIITLLLTSGARHPYKIDERYLTKRNVTVPELTESGKKDPFSISVYTLKELILREWREEWEVAPSSPSSIRLIFFGRLLDDSSPLKDCRFNAEGANVVHMTVRPQDIVDDEEAAKGKAASGNRGDGEDTAGCRCVIL